jgi:hypothetical protein
MRAHASFSPNDVFTGSCFITGSVVNKTQSDSDEHNLLLIADFMCIQIGLVHYYYMSSQPYDSSILHITQ